MHGPRFWILTAMTAKKYRDRLAAIGFPADHPFDTSLQTRDIHAVWIPEETVDIVAEGTRLKTLMDKYGNVNVFLCEGSGVKEIVAEMEAAGEEVPVMPLVA
jgi:pyrophosphate--fructose-6-phosphate 1-phosphotransferase